MMKLDFSGLEPSAPVKGNRDDLDDEILAVPSFALPTTADFDGFQKAAVQMVKPARGTTTLAFIFQGGDMVAADSRASMGGYILQTLHDCESIIAQYDEASLKDSVPSETATCISTFQHECLVLMSDDLHTPVALAAMSEPLKTINDLLHTKKALQQLKEYALKRAKLTDDQVMQKIEERNVARKNEEYEKSDAIRKDLADLGIALMDSPQGTT